MLVRFRVLATALVLASCSNGKKPSVGSIEGVFSVVGEPFGVPPRLTAGRVDVLAGGTNGAEVTTGYSAQNGHFSIKVPAGRYVLRAEMSGVPCYSDAVTVRNGQTVSADVTCNVG